jgi:hypothetical protein
VIYLETCAEVTSVFFCEGGSLHIQCKGFWNLFRKKKVPGICWNGDQKKKLSDQESGQP